jgi:HK97 family phage portal protein
MNIINKLGSFFGKTINTKKIQNAYNEAFFGFVGDVGTGYDQNAKTYIEDGYNVNSIVYSIVNQQARKSAKIPFYIKKVEDEKKAKQFLLEIKKENIGEPQLKLLAKRLEKKAFSEGDEMGMPIDKPNVFQSWGEFVSLYKTFLKLTGNAYIYMMSPEAGVNKGAPVSFYLLPSHLIDIVLKPNANLLLDESPIDYYRLIEGNTFKDFKAEDVIHIKYSNPNFDLRGAHLYGQSPLKSALKNIESSNEGVSQNIKTLKNSGAYGFIHGKTQPLTPDQALELKDRLKEMDDNPERLSRIAGVSAEVGFTRLTLTTDELKPFEYLSYDEKQLCNVLGWSDKLLNNDAGAKYSNIQEARKQVVVDDIMPDLGLLEQAFNDNILPRYKNYQNTVLYFDASTLPEMQMDMSSLTGWLTRALKDGVINRNEYREALNYPLLEEVEFDAYTVPGRLNPLDRAMEEPPAPVMGPQGPLKMPPKADAEKKNLRTTKAGFDPNQIKPVNTESFCDDPKKSLGIVERMMKALDNGDPGDITIKAN